MVLNGNFVQTILSDDYYSILRNVFMESRQKKKRLTKAARR